MHVFNRHKSVVPLILLAFYCIAFSNDAHAVPASPWTFEFTARNGISLSYNGVPIILKSTLYAYKPRWTGHVYNQIVDKQDVRKNADGTWQIAGASTNFRTKYDVRHLDTQTIQIHFQGELVNDIPAEIELNMGYFNSNIFLNRPYTALIKPPNRFPASKVSGIVPSRPLNQNWSANNLASNFESITLDSRVGRMTIKVISETPALFADARTNINIKSPIFPVYWLGKTLPLKVNQPVEMTLIMHVEPQESQDTKNISVSSTISPVKDAYIPVSQPIQIVPKPKQMRINDARHFMLRDGINWSVTAPAEEMRLTTAVQNIFGEEWKLRMSTPQIHKSSLNDWCGIRLGDDKPVIFSAEWSNAEWTKQADSYHLTIDANGVQIVAPTARGAYYGLQSLAQLLRFDGQAITVPFAEIEDWPTLQFRGALIHPLGVNVPFMKKLINIIGRNKYNYIVLSGLWVKWDSHPEIRKDDSISKDDLRDLVKLCRENFLEPIPLVNGPGHANWIIRNGQNLDLAEDPNVPQNYAVNNPKSLELVHELMTELIEIFQPKIFHIGSDEVGGGRYPNPNNPYHKPGQTSTDLIVENARLQHSWLAKRGIKAMMWGDMFLNKGEGVWEANGPSVEAAQKGRTELPKDIIMADWQYNNSDKYPSLNLFQKEGLTTIGTPWYGPLNIRNFTHMAIDNNAWGIMQSTWHAARGETVASTFMEHPRDYSAFFLGADYSWSGRTELPEALPYNPEVLLTRALVPPLPTKRNGNLINLDSIARVKAEDWVGLGQGWDIADFFAEQKGTAIRRFAGIDFRIPDRRFVVLAAQPGIESPEGAMQHLTLEIENKASEIAFLHTTLWNVYPSTAAARFTVNYTDGTSSDVLFRHGLNITGWHGGREVGHATSVWKGKTPAGDPTSLNIWRWINPHPDKMISNVKLEAVDAHASYALAGMTLIS